MLKGARKRMIVSMGEILFDVFPGYRRVGGAPFNFAYHMLKMGIQAEFVTRVGTDEAGRDIINFMDLNGFSISHVQRDPRHETGKVTVTLDNEGNPEFNIITNVAYDFIEFNADISELLHMTPDLIYFGTLAQRTDTGFDTLQQILSAREPNTRCIYDLNLRPNCYSEQAIKASLRQCDVVKMNADELRLLRKMHRFFGGDEAFIQYIMHAYGIEMLSLTQGNKGSALFSTTNAYHQEISAMETVVDTVGAGDAYAAVLALGYMNHWSPERILKNATALARRVCSIKGAIPKDTDFYKGLIDAEKATV
jgi:fructokinase